MGFQGMGKVGESWGGRGGGGAGGPSGVAEQRVCLRDHTRGLAGRRAGGGSNVPKIRDLEVDIQAVEAMPEVVVRLLGEGGNGLRSASPSSRGLLRRGVDRNHSMVRDIAEPVGLVSPPPSRVGRNSDTVEGGARPLCTTSGFRHGKQGGADSPHPVVELVAQQTLFIIARERTGQN